MRFEEFTCYDKIYLCNILTQNGCVLTSFVKFLFSFFRKGIRIKKKAVADNPLV